MRKNSNLAIPILITILLLGACSENKTTEDRIASATIALNNGDVNTAIINLKNVIKNDVNNSNARVLLGKIYLESGSGLNAEKELLKAYELGNIDAAILLLRAYKIQNKYSEILEFSEGLSFSQPEDWALVGVYKALSLFRLNKDELANQAINNAIEISADSSYGRLGAAYLATNEKNNSEALKILDQLFLETPDFIDGLMLKGQLSFANKDYKQAIVAFKRYQEIQPDDISIQLMLANSYVKNENYDEAEVHLDEVLLIAPNHAFTNQLKGVVRYAKNDLLNAKLHLDKAIQNGLNTPGNKLLTGVIAYQLEEYEQSYRYLSPLKEQLDKAHPAFRILTMTELALGYNDGAIENLEQFEQISEDDTSLYVAATYALIREGKDEEAKKVIKKLEGTELNDISNIMKLGILKLSLKDMEGLLDLEKAVDASPDHLQAKLSLVSAYVETNNFDKALKIVKNMQIEFPEDVLSYNLEGAIYLKTKEFNKAKSSFKKSLSLEPDNVTALMFFVKEHIKNENFVEAHKSISKILLKQPNNLGALVINYRIKKAQGDTSQAIVYLQEAFAEKKSIQYRLILAGAWLSERKYSNVINLLISIDDNEVQSLPNDYWSMLAASYKGTKQVDIALLTYSRWLEFNPKVLSAWLQKIDLQENENDIEGAIYTVNNAIREITKNNKLKIIKAHLLMLSNSPSASSDILKTLNTEELNLPFTQGLRGQILFSQEKYTEALPLLISGYKASPNAKYSTLIYLTYYVSKKQSLGLAFLERHLSDTPDDLRSRVLLADQYLAIKSKLAKSHYEIIVKTSTKNIPALNNLAGIYLKEGNLALANKYGMQAVELAPNIPEVLDTIGEIKIHLGDKKQALYYLKRALELSNNDEKIKVKYDKALSM
jgi:putative PEP-CTERM system TPR-repeat lipoprotein